MNYLTSFVILYLFLGCLFTLTAPYAYRKLHKYSIYKGQPIRTDLTTVLEELVESMYRPEGLRVIIAWPSHVVRIGRAFRVLKAYRELLQLRDVMEEFERDLEEFKAELDKISDKTKNN